MTKVVYLFQTCKQNMELTVDFISASFFVQKSAFFPYAIILKTGGSRFHR